MRHVMPNILDHIGIQTRQGRLQELRRTLGVERAQVFPVMVEAAEGGIHVLHQARVVGVADRIEVCWRQTGLLQTPAGRFHGKLPGGERHRGLAVFAAAEPFLLGSGHHVTVDHHCGGRVVKHRVYSKNAHVILLKSLLGKPFDGSGETVLAVHARPPAELFACRGDHRATPLRVVVVAFDELEGRLAAGQLPDRLGDL